MSVKVKVPIRAWINLFRKANKLYLQDIGEFIRDIIQNEIERTWDNQYRVNILVDEAQNKLTVVWGDSGEPPAELSGGGDLTGRFPKGATPETQISKTIVGQLRSVQPVLNWVNIGIVIGSIIPREFDRLIIKELETNYPAEQRYAQALRGAGIL